MLLIMRLKSNFFVKLWKYLTGHWGAILILSKREVFYGSIELKSISPFNVPCISYIERLFKYFQKENFFKYCFNYWTWIVLNSLSEYSSLNLNKAVDTILENYTPLKITSLNKSSCIIFLSDSKIQQRSMTTFDKLQ